MRAWFSILARLLWGIYFLLTSAYCLLAFLPYTYVALIKEPPYAWLPWFANHQALLYWLVLALLTAAQWESRRRLFWRLLLISLACAGIFLSFRPFMPGLLDNQAAYAWSVISLLPLIAATGFDFLSGSLDLGGSTEDTFSYSNAIWVAAIVTAIYALGVQVTAFAEHDSLGLGFGTLELSLWSLLSHALLAVLIVSLFNLVRMLCRRWQHSGTLSAVAGFVIAWAVLGMVLFRFLGSAFSFSGGHARLYAALLALALAAWAWSLATLFLNQVHSLRSEKSLLLMAAVALSLFAIFLPTTLGGSDWNGVLQSSFTFLFWVALCVCVYRLRPRKTNHSAVTVLAVVIFLGFAYKALQATEIFWARPLGSTDDEVEQAMESYAGSDASFQLVHHLLGNGRGVECGDLCRILRENTNVRDAYVKSDLKLVSRLTPIDGPKPNIFIFVIDSMRQDYVGAYNPKVDFTPNLDRFAADSVVIHNVYTQYAGTSLSEPAIWAGAMLLHAHYLQPFPRVNSLEKLVRTDGYQMVISDDEILRQVLSPDDRLIKLDTDKKLWNQLEVCSTIRQAEAWLGTSGNHEPVFFYTQPKNVHQFARNDLPMMTGDNWRLRPGFDNRIAYEVHQVDDCLGGFFGFLKTHALYDDSIIIVTSDHGDATGEFGRHSHSLSIFPEVMRVPMLIHLPQKMRNKLLYDDSHLSALTDITPSIYYLLGHRPILQNPLFGHPIFVEHREELNPRDELFLASDERAVYGLLTDDGKLLYTTYDSPARSFLFDLEHDPNALHNLIDDSSSKEYDARIIGYLQKIADFYGYRPGVGSLLAAR